MITKAVLELFHLTIPCSFLMGLMMRGLFSYEQTAICVSWTDGVLELGTCESVSIDFVVTN